MAASAEVISCSRRMGNLRTIARSHGIWWIVRQSLNIRLPATTHHGLVDEPIFKVLKPLQTHIHSAMSVCNHLLEHMPLPSCDLIKSYANDCETQTG